MFALANGHIGLRANLDEGEPFGLPGTYLNSFYELRPAAARGGRATATRSPARRSSTSPTARSSGCSSTTSPSTSATASSAATSASSTCGPASSAAPSSGCRRPATAFASRSTRLVSFAQRAAAAILYEVEPLDGPVRVVVQSELVANEPAPARSADPRAAAALDSPLQSEEHSSYENRVVLVHSTKRSKLRLAAAMDHLVDGPDGTETSTETAPDVGRVTIAADLAAGQRLRVVKFLAYGWSSQRSLPAVRDQVVAALAEARHTGWDGLRRGAARVPRRLLGRAPTSSSTATPSCSRRSASRSSTRCRPAPAPSSARSRAKGLTGPGYDGHTFWDTERFVLPVLTYTAPRRGRRRAALAPLDARPRTRARAPARPRGRGVPVAHDPRPGVLGLLAGRHRGVPHRRGHRRRRRALLRTRRATTAFEREVGLELLVETARLWRSLGHHDAARPLPHRRRHRPRRVQRDRRQQRLHEPDGAAEPARRGRRRRSAIRGRPPRSAPTSRRRRPGATPPTHMVVPWDEALGVHPQSEGFTEHAALGLRRAPAPTQYPLLLHYPYFDLYRKQVVKQADLVLALHARGDAFTDEEKARDFAYYEALTVRDSSLSACTQAVIAAEVGHLELAYDYFGEAALMDLHDLEHNTATACTSRRSPAPGSPRSPASAACATTTGSSPSRRGCRRGSSASPSASPSAAACSRSR